jgi:hypothetical protein
MLTQVVRTSKKFLVCENLLDCGIVGTTDLWGRSAIVLLLLTPKWCRGSRGVALSRLVTVASKVPRAPVVETRVARPCSLRRSRWSTLLWVDRRTWSYLLRCTVAPLLRWRRTTRLAYRRSVDQVVLGQSGPLAHLLFLRGTDGIVLSDGSTHELDAGLAVEGHEVLTDLHAQPLVEQGHLLCICVNVV